MGYKLRVLKLTFVIRAVGLVARESKKAGWERKETEGSAVQLNS
jgi:hypothetical protein